MAAPVAGGAPLNTARLKPWQIWLLVVSGGILWTSGSAWLVLYYFFRPEGEFGEINPAELTMMEIHGAAMPVALLAAGSLLAVHFSKGWNYRHQRVPGVIMATCLAVMIVTSYFLHYAADEDIHAWASTIHWVIGLGLPALFTFHWLNGTARRKS